MLKILLIVTAWLATVSVALARPGIPNEFFSTENDGDRNVQFFSNSPSRFEVHGIMATGSQCSLYFATDIELLRHVAIKVYHDESTDDDAAHEGKLLAQVDSPYVVKVFGSGKHMKRRYIILEWIETTYPAWQRQTLPTVANLGIAVSQVAEGVEALHEQDITHLDLKPSNVLMFNRPEGWVPKIIDLGLARWALHPPSFVGGTSRYMSPEQARMGETDARTDVFLLGSLLYDGLTGKAPYAAATSAESKALALNCEFNRRRPSNVPSGIWDDVILRAMACDPSKRFPSAIALAIKLREEAQKLAVEAGLNK